MNVERIVRSLFKERRSSSDRRYDPLVLGGDISTFYLDEDSGLFVPRNRLASQRNSDVHYGIGERFMQDKQFDRARGFYAKAKEQLVDRIAHPKGADTETFLALFLTTQRLQEFGHDTKSEQKEYCSILTKSYEQILGRNVHDDIIIYRRLAAIHALAQSPYSALYQRKADRFYDVHRLEKELRA